MATSKASICNNALTRIGAKRIISIDPPDDTEAAKACAAIFDETLEQLLVYSYWNFATKRATLNQETETPTHEFTYQYQLPTDCLKVRREINDAEYKIESGKLLSDDGTIQIVYTARITNMALLSPDFREAFELTLASKLAVTLKGSVKLEESMAQKAERKKISASAKDSQEGTPEDRPNGEWVTDR